jgi:hypothetical protein
MFYAYFLETAQNTKRSGLSYGCKKKKKMLKFSRFLERKLRDHMIGLAGLYLCASTPMFGSFHAGLSITALCGTTGAVRFFLFWQIFTRTAALSSNLNRFPSK